MVSAATKLIIVAFRWGMFFLALGRLPEALLWLGNHVALAQPQMVSLSKLNRALLNGGGHMVANHCAPAKRYGHTSAH